MKKKIVIIGAGPGGYEAALEGAKLGHNIVLIDSGTIGGTCLHHGCIPTKTLYKQAEFNHQLNSASDLGFHIAGYHLDYQQVQERKTKVIATLEQSILKALKQAKVEVIYGNASLIEGFVEVTTEQGCNKISYDELIIATGAIPKCLDMPGKNLPGVIDSAHLLALQQVPKSLIIIGGGVIGMEFACIFNQLGANVTVVEYLPRILSTLDESISKRLAAYAKKQGIKVITGAAAQEITKNDHLNLHYKDQKGNSQIIEGDYVLMAVGRVANLKTLGLEKLNITQAHGFIQVDENFRTSIDHIYAIGDVIGQGQLAHIATYQGKWLMRHLSGLNKPYKALWPSAVFVMPEIGTVGLTEEALKEQGIPYQVHKALFGAVGKAHAINETEGFIKILVDENQLILGVHIIGPSASILIQEAVIAITQNMTLEDLRDTIHVHPTLSEIYIV